MIFLFLLIGTLAKPTFFSPALARSPIFLGFEHKQVVRWLPSDLGTACQMCCTSFIVNSLLNSYRLTILFSNGTFNTTKRIFEAYLMQIFNIQGCIFVCCYQTSAVYQLEVYAAVVLRLLKPLFSWHINILNSNSLIQKVTLWIWLTEKEELKKF